MENNRIKLKENSKYQVSYKGLFLRSIEIIKITDKEITYVFKEEPFKIEHKTQFTEDIANFNKSFTVKVEY